MRNHKSEVNTYITEQTVTEAKPEHSLNLDLSNYSLMCTTVNIQKNFDSMIDIMMFLS